MKRLMVAVVLVGLLASPALVSAHGIDSVDNENEIDDIDIKGGRGGISAPINIDQHQFNTNIGGNNEINIEGGSEGSSGEVAVETEVNTSFTSNTKVDRPVSTATAPALTSGYDTCMGSTSIGGQGYAFGFSIGSTWTDPNCIRLKNANALSALGLQGAALSILAMDDDVAAALKANGIRYSSLRPTTVETVSGPVKVSSHTFVDGVDYGIEFEVMDE